MEFILGLCIFVLACFLWLSGPIAFFWLFRLRKQIEELTERNRKINATLRQLRQDIQAGKSESSTKSGIITLEAEESPFKADLPASPAPIVRSIVLPVVHPAAPVVPFAAAPPPSTGLDSGIRKRYEDSGIRSAARTTADWSNSSTPTSTSTFSSRKPIKIAEDSSVSQTLELWIGRKLFGWVAAVGFIVAAALFIQYAVKSGWVGPGLKVAAIAGFGAALLGIGFYCRRTGLRRFSTMMSSAGIILVYQAGYASFAFYKLIGFSTASVLMPIIVFGGFLLAWFYRSKLLGTVAILGGLAVPILIGSPNQDHYRELFMYLMSLNIGTLLLINLLRRAPIAFIAFFGTQALFWMWFAGYYENAKLVPALLFQGVFYFVYLADTAMAAWKPIGKKLIPTWDDAMRAVLAPIIFFGAITIFAENDGVIDTASSLMPVNQIALEEYLGIFAFLGAAWYVLLAILFPSSLGNGLNNVPSPLGGRVRVGADLVNASSPHPSLPPGGEGTILSPPPKGEGKGGVHWQAAPTAATVIAFGFIAIGIPLQFDAMWITLGWLTVFAGLWYFGNRQTNRTFVRMAYAFFALGICRLSTEMLDCLNEVREHIELTAVFNSIALPMLASAVVMIVVAVLASRFCSE